MKVLIEIEVKTETISINIQRQKLENEKEPIDAYEIAEKLGEMLNSQIYKMLKD